MKLILGLALGASAVHLQPDNFSVRSIKSLQSQIADQFAAKRLTAQTLHSKAKKLEARAQKDLARKIKQLSSSYNKQLETCTINSRPFWQNCKQCVSQQCTTFFQDQCAADSKKRLSQEEILKSLEQDRSSALADLEQLIELFNNVDPIYQLSLDTGDGSNGNGNFGLNIRMQSFRRGKRQIPSDEDCGFAVVQCTGADCDNFEIQDRYEILCLGSEEVDDSLWDEMYQPNPDLPFQKGTESRDWEAVGKSNVDFDISAELQQDEKTFIMIDLKQRLEQEQEFDVNETESNDFESESNGFGSETFGDDDLSSTEEFEVEIEYDENELIGNNSSSNTTEEEEFDPEEYFTEYFEPEELVDYDTAAGTDEEDLIKFIEKINIIQKMEDLTEAEKEEMMNDLLDGSSSEEDKLEILSNVNLPTDKESCALGNKALCAGLEENTDLLVNEFVEAMEMDAEDEGPCEDDISDVVKEADLPDEIGEALPDFEKLRDMSDEEFCLRFYNSKVCPKDVVVKRSAMIIQALRFKRSMKKKSKSKSDQNLVCQEIETTPQSCLDLDLDCGDCQAKLTEICPDYVGIRSQLSSELAKASSLQEQFNSVKSQQVEKLEWFTALEDENQEVRVYVQKAVYNPNNGQIRLAIKLGTGRLAENVLVTGNLPASLSLEDFGEIVAEEVYDNSEILMKMGRQ